MTSSLFFDERTTPLEPLDPPVAAALLTPAEGGSEAGIGTELGRLAAHFGRVLAEAMIRDPVAYRLVRQIGSGRQGVVFEAHRHGSRGCVTQHAVKVFHPGIYPDTGAYWNDMARIAQQVSRLQTGRSPHLVYGDAYEETGGVGYLQMERINGLNLRQLMERTRFETLRGVRPGRDWLRFLGVIFNRHESRLCVQPGVAVQILRQMLAGLEALHSAQYLHCDVKPLNVMIDRFGYVKIIDLGRAHSAADPGGRLLGTPAYMAPELHERRAPSVQSDIYSVGLVGLELLSGRRLVESGRLSSEELWEAKRALPDQLESILPPYVRCNRPLVGILRRFLDMDPAARFHSALAAETSAEGLGIVHRQLTHMDIDSDYRRDLAAYVTASLDQEEPHLDCPRPGMV